MLVIVEIWVITEMCCQISELFLLVLLEIQKFISISCHVRVN